MTAVGHNIAASLGSGVGLLVGAYDFDICGEAAWSTEGHIEVDFLTGRSSGGRPSRDLLNAIRLYHRALPGLCESHGIDPSAFKSLTASYATDRVHGGWFRLRVLDQEDRSFTGVYRATDGRRLT